MWDGCQFLHKSCSTPHPPLILHCTAWQWATVQCKACIVYSGGQWLFCQARPKVTPRTQNNSLRRQNPVKSQTCLPVWNYKQVGSLNSLGFGLISTLSCSPGPKLPWVEEISVSGFFALGYEAWAVGVCFKQQVHSFSGPKQAPRSLLVLDFKGTESFHNSQNSTSEWMIVPKFKRICRCLRSKDRQA